MLDLDLNLLVAFEAMLQHQNVTAAAAHNGVTQSAMSNALGRLRKRFGDPLFVNTRNGMLPTPVALDLARPLTEALVLIRATLNRDKAFDPRQSKRTFRFHMTDIGELTFVPDLLRRFEKLGITAKIETSQLPSDDIVDRLESGEIDLACGYLPSISGNVEQAPLFRERYVCAMRNAHPSMRSGGLTVRKYREATHVRIDSMGSDHPKLERALVARDIRREFAVSVPHYLVVPMIVSTTDHIATLPHRAARGLANIAKLRMVPLPVTIPSYDVCLFWHPRFSEDPPVAWMRELMLELFQEARVPKPRAGGAAERALDLSTY